MKTSEFSLRLFFSNFEVFHLRVFGLEYSGIMKPQSWKNSEFDQDVLRLVYVIKTNLVKVSY